ncbi:hypothetical protein K438DRAFT_1969390 [Mycena galopus ATCC 62051]|nr:hypothetical protein K438DRAFT_1969390 [Mycena galopus ATCC 62051]
MSTDAAQVPQRCPRRLVLESAWLVYFLCTAPATLNHAAPLPLADANPARTTLTLLLRAETASPARQHRRVARTHHRVARNPRTNQPRLRTPATLIHSRRPGHPAPAHPPPR